MPLFSIDGKDIEHKIRAKAILAHANDIAEKLKHLFLSSAESLWAVPGYTVADAQKVLDEMDILCPGSAIASFQMHGAFGQFMTAVVPGALTEEQLSAPVAYEIEMLEGVPHIKLTGETYPTERSDEV